MQKIRKGWWAISDKKESTIIDIERLRGSMALNKGEEADEAVLQSNSVVSPW